jgi:hypothetical protein
MKSTLTVLGATAVTLIVAGPLFAADFCLSFSGTQIVCKAFRIPGHGKCKPCYGFFNEPGDSRVDGTACTSDDNSRLVFNLTGTSRAVPPPLVTVDNILINLPALTGSTYRTTMSNAPGNPVYGSTAAVTASSCHVAVP